jgi:hypothetical protein
MSEPAIKRQAIVDELVTLCELITVANGYRSNAGLSVGDWQLHWHEAELPAISVCDVEEDVQTDVVDEFIDIYRLAIIIRVQFAAETIPSEARKVIADVLNAIGTNPRLTVDGTPLAHKLDVRRTQLIQSEDSHQIGAGAVELDIYYSSERFSYT